MLKTILVLASLFCLGQARRMQSPEVQQPQAKTADPLKTLAMALMSNEPIAAFNPAVAGGINAGPAARRVQTPRMQGGETFAAAVSASTPKIKRLKESEEERIVREAREAEERAAYDGTDEEDQEQQKMFEMFQSIPEDLEGGDMGKFMYKSGVAAILDKLDYDLIGLTAVKARVRQIASLLVVDKMRLRLGLETSMPSLHMCFTGAPGTGKTTVALRMGQVLQKMGYCRRGHVVVATRDDLVGQYVGHTAPKTKEMIKKAMGGILFVDEAYYLYNAENERDYGMESIEIILSVMEENKEDLIVVVAGYKDLMEEFFSFSPGFYGRIGNHIDFPHYEIPELIEISRVMCRDNDYILTDEATMALCEYLAKRMTLPFFSNARTVRNVLDLAKMKQGVRVMQEKLGPSSDGLITKRELQTFSPVDIPTITEMREDDIVQ